MTLFLLLWACAPSSSIELGGNDTGSPAPRDSADDGIELIPSPDPVAQLGEPVIEPAGGAFTSSMEVSLRVDDGEGQLEYCLADPDEDDCDYEPYGEPLTLRASTIVHARVVREAEVSAGVAHSFVEVSASVANQFSSALPVLLFWTDGSAPNSTADEPMGITVLSPPNGGELSLLDAPESSGRARLHVRGSSSSGWEKRSWDLELWDADAETDRTESLAGLPADGDWVLYAPYYYDEALIRNPLAFAVSEAVGRYAPRTRFVEVFVAERGDAIDQNAYQGVYVLMEEVERGADRVNITELLPEDVAEPEVTGGYLFKVDRLGEGESGFSAGTGGGVWQFQQTFAWVEPGEEALEREQMRYLEGELDGIGDSLLEADFVDPRSGRRYDEILDVDSFIDHHIINLVMKNPDALRLSAYMFKERDGLVQAGPVWDFDRAASSQDSRSYDPRWWDNQNETTDCTDMWEFGWYPGMFEDPAFADRYWARFESLLDNELSAENLDAMILDLAEPLDDAAERNHDRWGGAEFRPEIEELRNWMSIRHAWMRDCISAYADPRMCPGR